MLLLSYQNLRPLHQQPIMSHSPDDPYTSHSPSPFPSPLPIPAPSYEDHLNGGPHPHSSPAFDYHEERRTHLKDEIWMSHHLPRLPPPSASEAGSSVRTDTGSSFKNRMAPGDYFDTSNPTGPARQLSPKASFNPSVLRANMSNIEKGGEGMTMREHEVDPDVNDLGTALRQATLRLDKESTMLSPSGPEYGDLDPAPALAHRKEMDAQERLDLEEEKKEKELAMKAFVGEEEGRQTQVQPRQSSDVRE